MKIEIEIGDIHPGVSGAVRVVRRDTTNAVRIEIDIQDNDQLTIHFLDQNELMSWLNRLNLAARSQTYEKYDG
jgi:hypothetical protein